jgi:hypothetical protein
LGALCHHNSRHIGLGKGFHESAAVFARKWKHRLPIATPRVIIDRDGAVQLLGHATTGPPSIAYALSSGRTRNASVCDEASTDHVSVRINGENLEGNGMNSVLHRRER